GLRDAQQGDPRARARTEVEPVVGARRAKQGDDVAIDALLDVDTLCVLREADRLPRIGHRLQRVERRVGGLLGQHARLLWERRGADLGAHCESGGLRLRQGETPPPLPPGLRGPPAEQRRPPLPPPPPPTPPPP